MDTKTKAVLKSGYISCLVTLVMSIVIMLSGMNYAGSEMVHRGLKIFVLSTVIGLAIEINNKLKTE